MNTSPIRTLAAKACDKLLRDARRVFGENLITRAWHVDEGQDFARSRKTAVRDQESYEESGKNDICLNTNRAVMLEFCNGSKVIFSTSEWGGINRPEAQIVEVGN